MATEVRTVPRYQPPDWHTNNYKISTNSERQQAASNQIRQEGRFLRNETDNQTKWDQFQNNTRLATRADEIRKWKEILEETMRNLDKEIGDLSEAKELTERSLEAKNLPTDVVNDCLTLREGRRSIDTVSDGPEYELKKEQDVIAKIKAQLQTKCGEAFEQLCLLQEARQQVQKDLNDKNIALGIDIEQYNGPPNISFKPDSMRVPKGSTTPQQWEDFSRYNKERADAEMQGGLRLREAIHHTLQATDNDLDAQKKATDYALRKRMHELQRAKDELEWQKKNTMDEIDQMKNDIKGLEDAIRDKKNPMKLAQTRLENRTYRPNTELCRDSPQYGLTDEVKQLEATKNALQEKLKQALHGLDGLENNLYRINQDLECKENSIMLDDRAIKTRDKLNTTPPGTVEKNCTLTGIEREKFKVLA